MVRLLLLGLLTVLLAFAGCKSGSDPAACHPVSGQVQVDGQPAGYAKVVFHRQNAPEGQPATTTAVTDGNGAFRLTTFQLNDGVPAGEYIVTVVWPRYTEGREGEMVPGPDRLRGRFAQPAVSSLKTNIVEGKNDLPPFQLSTR